MGIKFRNKTKLKATLAMFNKLTSYLFEQAYDELEYFSREQKEAVKRAEQAFLEVLNNN
jgi:hypothetical protein